MDRRHFLQGRNEVLPDHRAVLDDEGLELAHRSRGFRQRVWLVSHGKRWNGRFDEWRQWRCTRGWQAGTTKCLAKQMRAGSGKHPSVRRIAPTSGPAAHRAGAGRSRVGRNGRRGQDLVVGSKRFTESYILGEILTQTLAAAGTPASHKPGLGNTGILEQALTSGAVDLYPEYTGTIVRELLKREGNPSLEELNRWLAPRGLKAAVPFGFNNTYALAMTEAEASARGIRRISDLLGPAGPRLRFGLSHEFLARADGWPRWSGPCGASRRRGPAGLDHGLRTTRHRRQVASTATPPRQAVRSPCAC